MIVLVQLINNVIFNLFLFYFNRLCVSNLAKQMVMRN